MFCIKCGQEVPVGAHFCVICGSEQPGHFQQQSMKQPVQPQFQQSIQQPMQPQGQFYVGGPMNGFQKPRKRKKIGIILSIVSVLCIAAAILLPLNMNGKSSSKRVLKKYFSSIEESDYDRYLSILLPEDREYHEDRLAEYDDDKIWYMEDCFVTILDWSIVKYRELSGDEIDDLRSNGMKNYSSKYDVKRVFVYTVRAKYEARDGIYNDHWDLYIVKVGHRWYMLD